MRRVSCQDGAWRRVHDGTSCPDCATNATRYLSELTDVLYMTRYTTVGYPHDLYQDMYGELTEIEAASWRMLARTQRDFAECMVMGNPNHGKVPRSKMD